MRFLFCRRVRSIPVQSELGFYLVGGYVVFLSGKVRMEKELEQYEQAMERLVAEGQWSWVNRKVVPGYYQGQDGKISLQKT